MGRRLLSVYGDFIATYSGEGTLLLKNTKTIPCTFEAGQLRNGQIWLLCSLSEFYWPDMSVKRFDGTTSEGYHVSSVSNLMNIDLQISSASGTWAAFRLDEMTIQMVEHSQVQTLRFGLTNFIFHKKFTVHLEHDNEITVLSIQPIERHEDAIWSIPTLRGVDVTCEAVCTLTKSRELLEDVVNDLCYLLSVARGTKVQWIYLDQFDENEVCVARMHAARIAKGYCPLFVFNGDEEIKTFVEKTYSTYKTNREDYKLTQGTIDTFLDAKAENDYLQVRGIKLVVAMETLKAVWLKLPQVNVKEYIFENDEFKKIKQKIEKFVRKELKAENIGPSHRDAVSRKLTELRRRPFKDVLLDIFACIGLSVDKQELSLFIKCRDSLVHQGRFYYETATPDDRRQIEPLNSEAEEYFFLVSFLDRVFLKLLGYSGPYIDNRLPGQQNYRVLD